MHVFLEYLQPGLRFKFLAACSLCFRDLELQPEKNLSRIHLSVKWISR